MQSAKLDRHVSTVASKGQTKLKLRVFFAFFTFFVVAVATTITHTWHTGDVPVG